jgi:hypothetical protein
MGRRRATEWAEGELLIDMEEALADGSPAAIRAVVDKLLD